MAICHGLNSVETRRIGGELYNCCMQVEDDQGYSGFRLTKSLVKYAAQALTMNLQVMSPKILPLPNHRPKMSGVVRMLEGGGLAEKWEASQRAESTRSREMNSLLQSTTPIILMILHYLLKQWNFLGSEFM
ncbi:hypothetical protein TanjilG_25179 [Lupinus angustifolius]|uniref:FAE domain-containing protein n=1 Tax=Lupinus angustifolius TaxID=3871 RepID=A0A1J7H122_LUPAN|nr:PREDICTED: uncharacterized protein LOC109329529 [Lupinus angustifolius]OIV95508.1 hypothetical protein TanjilG_25179 [Lupinus angustifolius]